MMGAQQPAMLSKAFSPEQQQALLQQRQQQQMMQSQPMMVQPRLAQPPQGVVPPHQAMRPMPAQMAPPAQLAQPSGATRRRQAQRGTPAVEPNVTLIILGRNLNEFSATAETEERWTTHISRSGACQVHPVPMSKHSYG